MKKLTFTLAALLSALLVVAQETRDSHGIITDVPANAKMKQYKRTGNFMYVEESMYFSFEQTGYVTVAECEDGTMYFKDLVQMMQYDTWVKGKREGEKVTIEKGQPVKYSGGSTISIYRLTYNNGTFVKTEDDITYTVTNESGRDVLWVDGCDTYYDTVGGLKDSDNSMIEPGDYASVLTYDPDTDPDAKPELVVLPNGVTTKTCAIKAYSYANEEMIEYSVKIGFDGDDVYLGGIMSDLKNGYVKGVKQGTSLIFSTDQYIGLFQGYYPIYVVAGTSEYEELNSWTLTYDASTGMYTTEATLFFAIDPYIGERNCVEYIDQIEIEGSTVGIRSPRTTPSTINRKFLQKGKVVIRKDGNNYNVDGTR